MRLHTILITLFATAVVGACSGPVQEKAPTPDIEAEVKVEVKTVALSEILSHPRRADEASRDKFRNPEATLEFFEVGPGKRVGEVWPGWYTNVTAPYLAANDGQYVAVLFPLGLGDNYDARIAAYKDKYGDEGTYGEIEYANFIKDSGPILEEGQEQLDVLLTFRNVHNWMASDYSQDAFNRFYDALKPGGILGVVEHRLPETAVQDPKGSTGYVQESYMKDLAQRAGFEFVSASEINANPRDTADHPFGVWTLPPRSKLPEEGSVAAADFNANAFKNIGESDRATLKFRKPK